MRRLGPESTHTSAGRRISRLPTTDKAAQRRAVRWALMSQCTATWQATILILPRHASDKGEYLQRTAEAAAGTLHPGDHDCGSAHHHQRGMGRH
jgi:hypothetical protein